LQDLSEKKLSNLLIIIEKVVESGKSIYTFCQELDNILRQELLSLVGVGESRLKLFSRESLILIIKKLNRVAKEIPESLIEQLPLEIFVIEWCDEGIGEKRTVEKTTPPDEIESKAEVKPLMKVESEISALSSEIWNKILMSIRPINASTEALLRAARPVGISGDVLTLGVFYKFHKEHLESVIHKNILEKTTSEILGKRFRVNFSYLQEK